ncbi:MAG: hypothetical protein WC857_00795 [Candidatus Paceibacterota bacterium]|jgi:hypothetical protein
MEAKMDWSIFFGRLTMILSILMVLVGLTNQVRKNYKEKRAGNPLSLAILATSVYFSRASYALTISSFYILVPDMIGVLLGGVAVYQHFHYRKQIQRGVR